MDWVSQFWDSPAFDGSSAATFCPALGSFLLFGRCFDLINGEMCQLRQVYQKLAHLNALVNVPVLQLHANWRIKTLESWTYKSSPKPFFQLLQFVIRWLLPTLNLHLDSINLLCLCMAPTFDIHWYGFKWAPSPYPNEKQTNEFQGFEHGFDTFEVRGQNLGQITDLCTLLSQPNRLGLCSMSWMLTNNKPK